MENASKALIIAGAILLAILLISLGIMIYNQAQNTVNNSGMSEAESSSFNNKFLKYEGTQTGSVVKSLINEVIVTNSQGERQVKFKGAGNTTETTTPTTSGVDTKKSYSVKLTYSNGVVSSIEVTP